MTKPVTPPPATPRAATPIPGKPQARGPASPLARQGDGKPLVR